MRGASDTGLADCPADGPADGPGTETPGDVVSLWGHCPLGKARSSVSTAVAEPRAFE